MRIQNPYRPPDASKMPNDSGKREHTFDEPLKIRGWLILPAIELILGLWVTLRIALSAYDLQWQVGMLGPRPPDMPGAGLYQYYLWTAVVCSCFFFFLLYVAVAFFKKRAVAPRLMVVMYSLRIAIALINAVWFALFITYSPDDPFAATFNARHVNYVIATVVSGGIWIPYFIVSKRVRATFTDLTKTHNDQPVVENRQDEAIEDDTNG